VRLTPLPPPDPRALDRAAELIRAASRPVVIVGRQFDSPADAGWLRALAEALPAPVLTTWTAQPVLPDAHPLALGSLTGGAEDDGVLGLADLVVAFGLEPEELGPDRWPASAPIVHVARTAGASQPVTPLVHVVGDPGLILAELAPRLRGQTRADWDMFQLDRMKRERERGARLGSPPGTASKG
jgi:acetolactate synthase-1/2/3 large subunit